MTAVATSPIARICEVSCAASWLTLSVRSSPETGGAGHVGLTAELAFEADLARDRRHLVGEPVASVSIMPLIVSASSAISPFASQRQLTLEVAVRDAGDDARDAANLFGEVPGHEVDGVGEVLPGAGDAGDPGLTAELPFGADLARDTRDFAMRRR